VTQNRAERIAIHSWMLQAMSAERPECWFCGREVVWRPELKTNDHAKPDDWPTYDHLISRVNTDRPGSERDAAGGVLACNECNCQRGVWSWLLTARGCRKERGAPYPRRPAPSGHIWVLEPDDPDYALLRTCERCGMQGKRLFAQTSAWWWKGARERGWRTGGIRRCDDELAGRPGRRFTEGSPGSAARGQHTRERRKRKRQRGAA
jgi:hypothetical protein